LGIFAAAAGETNLTGSKVEFGRKKKNCHLLPTFVKLQLIFFILTRITTTLYLPH
jgi:hypothetical protein